MSKSGITRRIDELGRIVIPKEIRYNLGIRDGELLEIGIENQSIIIKKFSQIENIKDVSTNICNIINDVFNLDILISDREKIISCCSNLSDLLSYKLDEKFKVLIDNRETYISENLETNFNHNKYFFIVPIITSTDCSGLVIIMSKSRDEINLKYAKLVQKLIVKKLDII